MLKINIIENLSKTTFNIVNKVFNILFLHSKKRILIALAMKNLNHSLISNEGMSEGDLAWINESDIHLLPPGDLSVLYSNDDLLPWVLVAKNNSEKDL